MFSSELDPFHVHKSPGLDAKHQETIFLGVSSLPSGLGGPKSPDQANASCLVRREGREWPTSEEQAGMGSKKAVPFGGKMVDFYDL